jgi:hypothetical protein
LIVVIADGRQGISQILNICRLQRSELADSAIDVRGLPMTDLPVLIHLAEQAVAKARPPQRPFGAAHFPTQRA